MKAKKLILVLGLLALVASACGALGANPTGTPPVVQLMPDLPGYKVVEDESVQTYIARLAEGGTLLAGHPELTALIVKVDSVIACYKDLGALNARIYSSIDFPLSSGIIAIADRNRLSDPRTLFECVGGQVTIFSNQPTLSPCSHKYTLERDNNEFYIIYAGTTSEICQLFCENLEGCTAQK